MGVGLRPSRYPSRATTSRHEIHKTLDEGLFCTIAFLRDGIAHQIPTGFCRIGEWLYIHASAKSGFMDTIIGQEVSFSVTHLDALVLAPTAFDHSFNYRSVVGFSKAAEVVDPLRKVEVMEEFTNRYIPGRIADVGRPTDEQVQVTSVVELSLEKAAVKSRNGESGTSQMQANPIKWVGIVPVQRKFGDPIPDEAYTDVDVPDYLKRLVSFDRST